MSDVFETKGGYFISQIKQLSGRVFERMLLDYGLDAFNGAQGRILYVLWKQDGIPIRSLSEATGLAKTTLTGMLDRMEKQGLISRVLDASDRRLIRIALSQKSIDLKEQYQQISERMSKCFYYGFSNEEIQHFEEQLTRILSNLKHEEEKR